MSAQPTLIAITKADGSNVILPSNSGNPIGKSGLAQAVRNDAAFGSGIYYAYFSDGSREIIGGPGVPPSVAFDSGLARRLAVEGSGIQNITTQGRPQLIWLSAFDSISIELFSKGIIHCNSVLLQNVQSWSDPATTSNRGEGESQTSIYIATNGDTDGMQASVTAVTDNGFELTWLKLGAGRDVTFQYHVITK